MFTKKLASTILSPIKMKINRFHPKGVVRFYPYNVPLRHSFCIQKGDQKKIDKVKVWDELLDEDFRTRDSTVMLDLCQKAINQKEDIENHPDRDKLLSEIHFNISLILLEQDDIQGALDSLKTAKDILLKSNQEIDEEYLMEIYNQMNCLYGHLEKWEVSINHGELALKIHKKLNLKDNRRKAATLANMSLAYLRINDMEKCKEKVDEAIHVYKEVEGKYSPYLINCYNIRMQSSLFQGDWELFFQDVDDVIEIGTKSGGLTRDEDLQVTFLLLDNVMGTVIKESSSKIFAVATRLETMLEKFFWDKTEFKFWSAYVNLAFVYDSIQRPKKFLQLLEKAEKIHLLATGLDKFDYPTKAEALMDLGGYQEAQSHMLKLEELLDDQASEISREEFANKKKSLDYLYMKLYLRLGEYQKSLSYIEEIEPNSSEETFWMIFRKTLNYYCLGKQEEASEFVEDLFKSWEGLSGSEKRSLERVILNGIRPLLDDEVSNKSLQKMLEDMFDQMQESENLVSELIPLFIQTLAQSYYNQREYDKCAQALEALIKHLENVKIDEPDRIFNVITFGSNVIGTRIPELWTVLLDNKAEDINERKKNKIASLWMESSLRVLECHRFPLFLAKEGFERCETILISKNSPEAKTLFGHTKLYLGYIYLEYNFFWVSKKYLTQSIQAFEACKNEQINLALAYLLLANCYMGAF